MLYEVIFARYERMLVIFNDSILNEFGCKYREFYLGSVRSSLDILAYEKAIVKIYNLLRVHFDIKNYIFFQSKRYKNFVLD